MRSAFNKVRDELDNHLDTINRNSEEIHSLYDFLMGLEQKLDKLAERIDELQANQEPRISAPLTLREQEVFLVLYAAEEPVTHTTITSRLGITEGRIGGVIGNLVAKGVPVLQQGFNGDTAYALELRFKELQARKNIVHIDERVSRSLVEETSLK